MDLITSTTTLHPEQAMYNMQTTGRIRANADLDCDNSAMRATWTQTWVHRPIAAACMQGDLHDAYCAVCMCGGPVHVSTPHSSAKPSDLASHLPLLFIRAPVNAQPASAWHCMHANGSAGCDVTPSAQGLCHTQLDVSSPCGSWPDPCGSWLESSAPATLPSNTWLCSLSDASNAV